VATKVRIEMNSAGFRALLRSQPVLDDLARRADAIAAAAGEGFEADARVGANRARASVRTATAEARRAEAVDKALTSAIDAGR
jgi:hypothetical protein